MQECPPYEQPLCVFCAVAYEDCVSLVAVRARLAKDEAVGGREQEAVADDDGAALDPLDVVVSVVVKDAEMYSTKYLL